jgi:hypothetical protein
MKTIKTILGFLALLVALPAHATWTLVDANTCNTSCSSGTTCTVSMNTNTVAGNVLVAAYIGNANSSMTNMTGGTFLHCSSCKGGTSGTDFIDMGGTLSATGGNGTITVTISPTSSSWAICVSEWHSNTTYAVDTQATHLDSACTTCAGPALTLTGSNDLIVQLAGCTNTCATSATAGFIGASPWTDPAQAPGGSGWGAAINQASYTAPNWSQNTSGAVQVSAWAFKETGVPAQPKGQVVSF